MEALVDRLLTWDEPAVRYQARLVLAGADPDSGDMRDLAETVRASADCRAVIEGSLADPLHPYRKWQGAHWALVQLAERGHPGGDTRLEAIQEVVFSWILSPAFLEPNWTRRVEGQPERVRRCASMEGNVIWASLELGLMDARLGELAARLGRLQWPDEPPRASWRLHDLRGWSHDRTEEAGEVPGVGTPSGGASGGGASG